jgi:hypothetical protein
VKLIVCPAHTDAVAVAEATGAAVTVTVAVPEFAQGPGVVYVTVYVFSALLLNAILPVLALMLNPEGEALNVPPATPVTVGAGLPADWQNDADE